MNAFDHTGQSVIESALALIKLKVGIKERTEILQIAEHYRAKVVDYGANSMITCAPPRARAASSTRSSALPSSPS